MGESVAVKTTHEPTKSTVDVTLTFKRNGAEVKSIRATVPGEFYDDVDAFVKYLERMMIQGFEAMDR